MAVVLPNVAQHDWGWFSREDERLHIQTVDSGARSGPGKVKFWLEDRGVRTFVGAVGKIPSKDRKRLAAKVQANRARIEDRWVVFMLSNGWLAVSISGSTLTLTAYPKSHNRYSRTLNLVDTYPGAYQGLNNWHQTPPSVDFDMARGLLAIGPSDNPDDRNHIEIAEVLFKG